MSARPVDVQIAGVGPSGSAARGGLRPRRSGSGKSPAACRERTVARRCALCAVAFAALALGTGCASVSQRVEPPPESHAESHAMPTLRLAPALLGRTLALQQRITVHAPHRHEQLDVLLEADPDRVQLAMISMGRVAARLSWDGAELTETRASGVPSEVSASRILSELQLTLWPVPAIRAALPPGWQIDEAGGVRTLRERGEVVAVVTRLGPGVVEFDQRRDHYRLTIESHALGAGGAP
jgi:Protein of unknown function (DUF3261)